MQSHLMDRISQSAAVLLCLILVAIVVLISVEITLRSFFDSSTYVLDEFVGYGIAAMTFLAFAATLKDGVFIRVEMVLANLKTARRRQFEIVSCFIGATLFGGLTWYVGKLIYRNFDRGIVSNSIAEVPLWIPQSFILIGLVLLVLQFVVMGLAAFAGKETPNIELATEGARHD